MNQHPSGKAPAGARIAEPRQRASRARELTLKAKVTLLLLAVATPSLAGAALLGFLSLGTPPGAAGVAPMFLRCAAVAIVAGAGAATWLAIAVHRTIARTSGVVMQATRAMVSGDLTRKIDVQGRDELALIGQEIEAINVNLSATVANINTMSALVRQTAETLTRDNVELSRRTEQQAASLEETSSSVQDIARTVHANDEAAQQAEQQARGLSGLAEQGAQAMREAVARMDGIEQSSRRVSEIVSLIDGIAFQTNILALNAAVEAARAGEQGRGFAVVASEVRTLARRSGEAAREIKALIDASMGEVAEGAQRIRGVNATLESIVGGIRAMAQQMQAIAAESASQSAGLNQITGVVAELDGLTQHNASMVEQATRLARELGERADTLESSVRGFRLRQGTAYEAMALIDRAIEEARRAGVAGALSAYTNPAREFHDRDLYVFAIDRSGSYRAFGGRPDKVGTSIVEAIGSSGERMVADAFARAAEGGGWVEYEIVNPLTRVAAPKMSYIRPLDDQLVVGCGVYKTVSA